MVDTREISSSQVGFCFMRLCSVFQIITYLSLTHHALINYFQCFSLLSHPLRGHVAFHLLGMMPHSTPFPCPVLSFPTSISLFCQSLPTLPRLTLLYPTHTSLLTLLTLRGLTIPFTTLVHPISLTLTCITACFHNSPYF